VVGVVLVFANDGPSKREATALRLFVLDASGRGDFVGDSGVSMTIEGVWLAARELIHERSSAAGVKLVFVGDVNAPPAPPNTDPVLCFSGDPCCGVAARTVEGDRPSGDSGLRKGDMRPLSLRPNDNGAGFSGLDGLDCCVVERQ
jgi:hypothetical protein